MANAVGGLLDGARGALSSLQSKAAEVARRLDDKSRKTPKYQPSPDEIKALGFIEEARRTRMVTLETFEPIWTLCILFTAGIQHTRWLSQNRTFEPVRHEDWMPMPVYNYIQPKVQRVTDFFTRNRPTAEVEPNSKKETDRKAAALANNVRMALWDKNDEEDLFDEAATWMVTTGNCFKRNFIDMTSAARTRLPRYEMAEEPLIDGKTGEPLFNEQTGEPIMVPKYVEARNPDGSPAFDEVQQGEVNSYVLGPISMTVPLAARKLDAAPWIMESSLQSIAELKEMYPDKADFLPEKGQVVTSDLYTHRLTTMLTSGMHGILRSMDPYSLEGYGFVNIYERRPDRDFRNGLLIVEFDGIPLLIDELPAKTRYSYSHAGYYRVNGRFWFRGMVEDQIEPQRQINKLEQFFQLNDAYNGNNQWLVPTESGIPKHALGNRPGRVHRYKYPYEPKALPGQPVQPQQVQRRAMYVQDMEEISGVRNVMMGDAPPGVTAGVALNRLGEESEGMFAPIEKRWNGFVERDQTLKLELVQLYYSIPRLLTYNDGGTVKEIQDFVGSMLKGNVRVKVRRASQRPRSKAGEQQLVIDALQLGLLPGVYVDPDQLRKVHDILGIEGFDVPESLDSRRAQWENEVLTEGGQVARQAGDDDAIHLHVHSNYMKTDDWLRIPLHIQQRHLQHQVVHLLAFIDAEGATNTGQIEPTEEDLEPAGAPGGSGEPGSEEEEMGEGGEEPAEPGGGSDEFAS